ncbi:MAG TPA: Uma2 family endonuclease [Pyrinomonadaceae bacterium]|nr:Uma2 family endonuclease [Pyrinomonadaceae bacterium]
MSRQVKAFITPEEYLAIERKAEHKSEYLHGEVFAMTGASRQHNLIAANISRTLGNQLVNGPCELYVSDMRVKVAVSGLYTYPDVAVVCGEPRFEDGFLDTLQNPTLLIEILSKSTERYDRIAKTDYYRTIDSLAEHLLVAQEEYRVEQYTRQPDGHWILAETSSLEGNVDLRSIECSLALIDVYHRVSLG